MGRHVWMLTNAPLPFHVASAASTPMAPTSACVWMATKPWSAILIRARLCQVCLIFALSTCRISECYCKSQSSPLTLHVPHFSWRAFSHYGGPPWDPEAECGWLQLHHLEAGKQNLHHCCIVPVETLSQDREWVLVPLLDWYTAKRCEQIVNQITILSSFCLNLNLSCVLDPACQLYS